MAAHASVIEKEKYFTVSLTLKKREPKKKLNSRKKNKMFK